MSNIHLLEPDLTHKDAILAFRQEFKESGETPYGSSMLHEFDSVDDWLHKADLHRDPDTVPKDRVQADLYIAVGDSTKILGMIHIRHTLNDFLENFGGHIGYCVAPTERRRGIATTMLRLALDKCRSLKLSKVLVTCDVNNPASAAVIKKCGGILQNEVVDSDGRTLQRYWIPLD